MQRSGIRATALAAIALVSPLGGSVGGGDCFEPADEVIQSAVGPGMNGDRILQVGACGLWVKLEDDGGSYTAYEPYEKDLWTFTEADLVPAGEAHQISIPMFAVRDSTIFAIPGVPIEDGFAMIAAGPPERVVVFTGSGLSDALCAHMVRLPRDPTTCLALRSASPSPTQ